MRGPRARMLAGRFWLNGHNLHVQLLTLSTAIFHITPKMDRDSVVHNEPHYPWSNILQKGPFSSDDGKAPWPHRREWVSPAPNPWKYSSMVLESTKRWAVLDLAPRITEDDNGRQANTLSKALFGTAETCWKASLSISFSCCSIKQLVKEF
jgi:hypothetical protein